MQICGFHFHDHNFISFLKFLCVQQLQPHLDQFCWMKLSFKQATKKCCNAKRNSSILKFPMQLSRSAFLNRRVVEDFKRVVEIFKLHGLFHSNKQKNTLVWVVGIFFFKNAGRGAIWVEKRCARLLKIASSTNQRKENINFVKIFQKLIFEVKK